MPGKKEKKLFILQTFKIYETFLLRVLMECNISTSDHKKFSYR